MKFENWKDEIIPREIQLDIVDIMNDLKDDIDCRVSYQWWPPYAKYDKLYKEGDKYPSINITNVTSKYLENYIKRIRVYLNEQGFNLTIRYDSSKNPHLPSNGNGRVERTWKILKKEIDFLTDFKFEMINRDIYGEKHPDFKNE